MLIADLLSLKIHPQKSMQTMFNGNSSITIPVSDDDSDEYTTKMRYRNRRKRKKSVSIRSNAELTRRVVRKIAKWWPLLLFLPAMALLLFEASRLSRNSVPHTKSTHIHVDHNIPHTNFNHVQPIYHTVAGVRQRKLIFDCTNPCKCLIYLGYY